jgi:hypothetical protein
MRMSNRPSNVVQADIARVIRAAKKAGLVIVRIVARPDGVSLETDKAPAPKAVPAEPAQKAIVL